MSSSSATARVVFLALSSGPRAAHPEQPLDRLQRLERPAHDRHVEVESLGPLQAHRRGHVPRVALALQATEQLASSAELSSTSTW